LGMAALTLAANCLGQGTNVQIIGATANKDRTVTIRWKSESNAVYRIDYASELVNSNTVWSTLYDRYPSHGTNTFWTDVGDYTQEPPIKRPQDSPMRFYRVTKTETNTAPAPYVVVTSPVGGATVSGELVISVVATSALPNLYVQLFVDGQEMNGSDDGTNFLINTTEWPNGPHLIFATARAASALGGIPNQPASTYGWKVSPYVNVTFSNYISEISFSEPYFEPALGQTQRVTAVFGAYSDWTIQVQDEFGNTVRTGTGSGHAMQFDWDGAGDGGAFLPDGVYEYLVSATEATDPGGSSGGGGGGEPSMPMMSAMAGGQTSYFTPAPPVPERFEKLYGPLSAIEVAIPGKVLDGFLAALAVESSGVSWQGGGSLLAAAAAPKVPKRPPVKPAKGVVSTFGIAYWTYPGGLTNQTPPDGLGGRVTIDGNITTSIAFPPVPDFKSCAAGFQKVMTSAAWKLGFHKFDGTLSKGELIRNDLIGYSGSNLFNTVDLGLFMSHGNFGSTLDFSQAAGQSRQTYFAVGGNNPPNSWIRLSDFRFGDKLKWMAILACNSLEEDAYQSMYNKFVLPIGDQNQPWTDQLHLLLGSRTYCAVTPNFGELWAKKMKGGLFASAQPVMDAWFNAGIDAYRGQPRTGIFANDLYFKVVGWDTTFGDKLRLYTIPDPTVDFLEDRNQRVFP